MRKFRKIIAIFILSLSGLCLLLVSASYLSNLRLPQHSSVIDRLSDADKARLIETLHLRQNLGDAVWPGWGQANIPVIVYNEANAFLIGYIDPPAGWIKIPAGIQRGRAWEPVAGDSFNNEPYYSQALTDPAITPQAFTVMVGERWAGSLQTLDWAKISLVQPIRSDLPGFVRPFFPYRLFIGQLVGSSDKYISLLAHETFHAYQGMAAAGKLNQAEEGGLQFESQYPWNDSSLQKDWQAELDLLASALRSAGQTDQAQLALQFLHQRLQRRQNAGLSPDLIRYEQQREWEEGLARYVELEIWRLAANGSYKPAVETAALPDFEGYSGFEKRWMQEIQQIGAMAKDEGDGRFYYSGMAQAYLLDALLPDWKMHAFDQGVWLDDLLAGALKQ